MSDKKKQDAKILQKWKKVTLANNFIFYKVMRNHPDACKHLLEILLNIKIKRMKISTEETLEIDNDAKGIRLDVYVNETKRMHDIELQVINTQELPKRSRYYAALMDCDTLKHGEKYSKLKDSHVIFICLEDVFDNELPINTFENICLEDGVTKLNDRAYKHFFIAPRCAKILKDKELKAFFEFLISNKAASNYTSTLDSYVKDAKRNMQWRMQYMTWERQRAYDFDAGKEAGLKQKAIEDAKSFYANGASIELIAKSLKMPIKKVQEIVSDVEVVVQ